MLPHCGPPEQRIANCLKSLLILDHSLALVSMPGRVAMNEVGHDGAASLLELEENDIIWAAALAERDISAQSHGPNPDDLVCDVHKGVATKDPRPVWWRCL
jgi:hypothetical protein